MEFTGFFLHAGFRHQLRGDHVQGVEVDQQPIVAVKFLGRRRHQPQLCFVRGVGDADGEDGDAVPLGGVRVGYGPVAVEGRLAVGNNHGYVRNVGSVSSKFGKLLGVHHPNAAAGVRVTSHITDVCDCVLDGSFVEVRVQIEHVVTVVGESNDANTRLFLADVQLVDDRFDEPEQEVVVINR